MAKTGSVIVASLALLFGAALGVAGVLLMLDAGSFLSAGRSQDNGMFGLFGGSDESASVKTSPWVGLFLAALGAGLLLFGFRALYLTFEGREPA